MCSLHSVHKMDTHVADDHVCSHARTAGWIFMNLGMDIMSLKAWYFVILFNFLHSLITVWWTHCELCELVM
jgi:hypothetical protein